MAVNKVIYGNDTLMDLTEDTVTADLVLSGASFHLASGASATGTAVGGSVVSGTDDGTNWTTITIDGTNRAIPSGGGEPNEYVKNFSVTPLTNVVFTDKDNTTLTISKDKNGHLAFEEAYSGGSHLFSFEKGSTVSGTDDGTNWSTITIDGTTKAIPSVSGTDDGINWSTITINGTMRSIPSGGSGEPSEYLKSASVSNSVLTLTKKDNTTVEFTNIFVATYGVTSYSEILAADNAGKLVLCKRYSYSSSTPAYILSDRSIGFWFTSLLTTIDSEGYKYATASVLHCDGGSNWTEKSGLLSYVVPTEEADNLRALKIDGVTYNVIPELPTSSGMYYLNYAYEDNSKSVEQLPGALATGEIQVNIDNLILPEGIPYIYDSATISFTYNGISVSFATTGTLELESATVTYDVSSQSELLHSIIHYNILSSDSSYVVVSFADSGSYTVSDFKIYQAGTPALDLTWETMEEIPLQYIRAAGVLDRTLTLVDQDNNETTFNGGNEVSASASGSSTTEVGFITIDGTEYKLPSGGGSSISGIANGTGTNSLLLGNTNTTYKIADANYSIIAGTYDRDYVAKIQASGLGSAIFGYFRSTSVSNPAAYAEGQGTFINGMVGGYTSMSKAMDAEGAGSHVEGYTDKSFGMRAYGDGSHVEGYSTGEYGMYISTGAKGAHIEGYCDAYGGMKATGIGSHAEGYNTIAASNYQHASGKFNIEDNLATYAFIIGNGTSNSARSNALTVDWNGNLAIAGAITASNIPAPPSTDGNYVLKCTVTGGAASYSWVAES